LVVVCIAIVAGFVGPWVTVSAGVWLTLGRTGLVRPDIAVVALLITCEDPVSALRGSFGTVGVAQTIATVCFAVIALFSVLDATVPAHRVRCIFGGQNLGIGV